MIYGGLYKYDKVKYLNAKTKVTVTCPIHGDFLAIPNNHLSGSGCQKCANNVRLTKQEFIARLDKVHGIGVLNVDDFKYINYKTAGIVTCTVCLEQFEATPNNLLSNKVGCPFCHQLNLEYKYVYVMEFTDFPDVFKIGVSNSPNRRRLELQQDSNSNVNILLKSNLLTNHVARTVEKVLLKDKELADIGIVFNGCKELIKINRDALLNEIEEYYPEYFHE